MKRILTGFAFALGLAVSLAPRGQDAPAPPANTGFETAAPVTLDSRVEGAIQRNQYGNTEYAYYVLTLDEANANTRFDVVATGHGGEGKVSVAYVDGKDGPIEAVEANDSGEARLVSYVLGAGKHVFRLSASGVGEGTPPAFTLSFEPRGTWQAGEEREPNLRHDLAYAGQVEPGMKGEFAGEETYDFIAFDVPEPLRLWTVEANGDGLRALRLSSATAGVEKESSKEGQEAAQMWSVLLPPGKVYFQVMGGKGAWNVKLTPSGPAPIEALSGTPAARKEGESDEIEPNGGFDRALILPVDGSRAGQIEGTDDIDTYRFTLDGPSRVKLALSGMNDMRLRANVYRVTTAMELKRFEMNREDPNSAAAMGTASQVFQLGQGDYYVEIRGDRREKTPYQLSVARLPVFGSDVDLEPNDDAIEASPLPTSLHLTGDLTGNDFDWYQLPDLDQPTTLTVKTAPSNNPLTLRVGTTTITSALNGPLSFDTSEADLQPNDDKTVYTIDLPAGKNRALKIRGDRSNIQPYDLALSFSAGPQAVSVSNTLVPALSFAHDKVAAFASVHQRVEVTLSVQNTGSAATDAALAFNLSDDRWVIEGAPQTLHIEAGQSAQAKFMLVAPPMQFDGSSIIFSAKAASDAAQGAVEAKISVSTDAPMASPERRWGVPTAMLGGIDVAWNMMGATTAEGTKHLIDGFATAGTAERIGASDDPENLAIIDLAGDAPIRITGVIVNPTNGPDFHDQIRTMAIETSVDGSNYTRQYEGEIGPRQQDYPIVFAAPVEAKFVKVLPLTPQRRQYSAPTIGEVKVIAAADTANTIAPQGFNLADPRLGGFVTEFRPVNVDFYRLLTGESSAGSAYFNNEETDRRMFWTMSFWNQRAARVARIEWRDNDDLDLDKAIHRVSVEAAMEANGPYEKVGVWDVHGPDGTGSAQPFLPEKPFWARFVRFTVEVPPKREDGASVYLLPPRQISIFEAPVSAEGGTVLGEWGIESREGPFEALHPLPLPQDAASLPPGGDNKETARALALDTPMPGRVSAGTRADWWAVEVPDGGQSLALTLANPLGLGVTTTMMDAAGNNVALAETARDGLSQTLSAKVKAGRYLVHVEEPPRSIAISWDTSGSVGPYVPTITQSVRGFARFLTPGRDEVSLLPFDDPKAEPLSAEWTGNPTTAFGLLSGYTWDAASSNGEGGVNGALSVLEGRPGTRAIILITDYATSGSQEQRMEALEGIKRIGARVFNFAIPSGSDTKDAAFERSLMQSFAGYSNGTATYAGTPAALEQAFARTAAALRAPKDYTITASVGMKPPEPGRIAVIVPPDVTPPPPKERAVLVILDASGSMLKKLGKKRRIEIAKDTLTELTQSMLPEGTPFAMRVFGDTKPDSCETNLRVKLAPLDRAAVKGAVDAIKSVNKAKTAIGASLAAAAGDLAGSNGQKLIILITDGEETCGADPLAEIGKLKEQGIDARISIVGFAVDDAALKDTFSEWAAAGGGGYFDATKPEELAPAVQKALLPPFEVVAADGTVVASGMSGGEPVEVPPGTYTIRILSDPPKDYPNIVVETGASASVTLAQ